MALKRRRSVDAAHGFYAWIARCSLPNLHQRRHRNTGLLKHISKIPLPELQQQTAHVIRTRDGDSHPPIIPNTECIVSKKHTAKDTKSKIGSLESTLESERLMPAHNSKPVLWGNLTTLMHQQFGGENLNRLAREAKLSPATASRIKAMETSVGIDVLDQLATVFGVEPWQLLHPDLGKSANFTVTASPLALDLARQLDELPSGDQQERAFMLASQLMLLASGGAGSTPESAPAPTASQDPTKQTPL